ncbi:MAG: replication initiator protein A [Clostridia bacterium]|nr:replication initiator protein A [Clostridia bacterium]
MNNQNIKQHVTDDISGYTFLRYPRALIDNPAFRHISIEARTLLALIIDRFALSNINADKFSDENGEIYVIYTIDEVCEKLGCANTRTLRIFNELESDGLIKRKRKNRFAPYRIYLTQRITEFIKQEVAGTENVNPRVNEIKTHGFTKREDINNNNSNNNIIKNNSSINNYVTEDEIKEQIEYDCIVCDANREILDELVMIISDVLCGSSESVRIGKDDMPRQAVVARFRKLTAEHIYYVFSKLRKNETDIRNIKPYIITMLYNAPSVMESEATADFAYHQKIS